MPAERRTKGYTLIELLAAFALLGIGIVLLHAVASTVAAEGSRTAPRAVSDNRRRNGEQLLQRLIENAVATGDSTNSFRGTPEGMKLRTRCAAPGGWLELCTVDIDIERGGDSSSVIVTGRDGTPIVAMRIRGSASLSYRDNAAAPTWLTDWGGTLSLPFAVRVIGERGDTVTFLIGDRG